MKSYKEQAHAISVIAKNYGADTPNLTACLHDAEVTLNALALVGQKRIIENERLRQIVEDFCAADPDMHRGEILAYQQDMKKIIGI